MSAKRRPRGLPLPSNPGWERWRRRLGSHCCRSHLAPGPARAVPRRPAARPVNAELALHAARPRDLDRKNASWPYVVPARPDMPVWPPQLDPQPPVAITERPALAGRILATGQAEGQAIDGLPVGSDVVPRTGPAVHEASSKATSTAVARIMSTPRRGAWLQPPFTSARLSARGECPSCRTPRLGARHSRDFAFVLVLTGWRLERPELLELSGQGQPLSRRACFTSRASATGPVCPSLSGLTTERIVWIRAPSTSIGNVPATLPSRSRRVVR